MPTLSVGDLANELASWKRDATTLQGLPDRDLDCLLNALDQLRGSVRKIRKQRPKVNAQPERRVKCYVCRIFQQRPAAEMYPSMCTSCARVEEAKSHQSRDLTGRYAIVTGGRIKIGFHIALRLLRAGCYVLVTTRFRDDCQRRFQSESDYKKFAQRFAVYELDLVSVQQVEQFLQFVRAKFTRLDIFINNAAQTIRRPREFYRHLLTSLPTSSFAEEEAAEIPAAGIQDELSNCTRPRKRLKLSEPSTIRQTCQDLIPGIGDAFSASPASSSSTGEGRVIGASDDFPVNCFDEHGQQIDKRTVNSWTLSADQVTLPELAEVQIINCMIPFYLGAQLKHLLARPVIRDSVTSKESRDFEYAYIINVSAVEGIFYINKTDKHPHTNIAKAGLNMFTRTCGADFKKHGIILASCDTGYCTDEHPFNPTRPAGATPLSVDDGAVRVLDPIFTKSTQSGVLYKDFAVHPW
jgi:NAD(P)-dependent dehydrogenase (short-subunit alcohol dehydrogenase family)